MEGGEWSWWEVRGRAFSVPLLPPDTLLLPLQNPGLVEQYFSAILSLEPNQNYAGMLGLLVQFCTNHKEMDVVSQHKASVKRSDSGFAASGVWRERVETCSVFVASSCSL